MSGVMNHEARVAIRGLFFCPKSDLKASYLVLPHFVAESMMLDRDFMRALGCVELLKNQHLKSLFGLINCPGGWRSFIQSQCPGKPPQ